MVMGNYKNSRVFNFAILLKSRKFDACKIYMLYNIVLLFESSSTVASHNTYL